MESAIRFSERLLAVVLLLSAGSAALGQVRTPGGLEKRPEGVDPFEWHVADPQSTAPLVRAEIEAATRPADRKFAENILKRLDRIVRPRQVHLSLQEAIHRAMANSYAVRIQSYEPAVSTAAVVEAEAVFDAVYFMDMSKNVQDRPVPSELVGSRVDVFSLNGGIRKPLPSGGQLTTRLNISRTSTDNQFQLIDPVYTSDFVAELAHPLLRNSGLDFNRSLISVARNDLRISRQAFKRQVRDILFATEEAYWRLVQTRREVLIQARLLSEFERTYDYLWQRRDFDVYQIQLSQTRAELERSRADFIRVVNQVYDAQDVLLAIMNDPTLNLVDEVELIPSAFPSAGPLEIDRVAAVREALENRTEVIEARLRIENAGLVVGRAKNQAMPRLDLLFRYTVNGLGVDADAAFSQVTQTDFIDYFVALDFELPMGNRSRKAAWRRARLRHAQAIATLKAQIENVVLDVNTSVRAIRTAYDRIEPSLRSAEANEEQVASTIARQERKDFSALNQELNARRALAGSRSALLADLVEYNIAIIAFERAKETLLNYNSIVLAGEDQGGGSVEVLPDTPE